MAGSQTPSTPKLAERLQHAAGAAAAAAAEQKTSVKSEEAEVPTDEDFEDGFAALGATPEERRALLEGPRFENLELALAELRSRREAQAASGEH